MQFRSYVTFKKKKESCNLNLSRRIYPFCRHCCLLSNSKSLILEIYFRRVVIKSKLTKIYIAIFFLTYLLRLKCVSFLLKLSRVYVDMCRSLKAAKSQLLRASWVFISDFYELYIYIYTFRRGTQLAKHIPSHMPVQYMQYIVYVATIRFKTYADLTCEL